MKKNLIIRFGKIGDGVTALNLAQKTRLGNFYTFGLRPPAPDILKHINSSYLGNLNLYGLLKGDYQSVIVYRHPKPSLIKITLIFLLLLIIRKEKLIYHNDKNQYSFLAYRKPESIIKKKITKYIVIAPHGSEKSKNLNDIYLNRIIEIFKQNVNIKIISDAQLDFKGINVENLSSRLDGREFVNVVKNADLVICVDSAPFHIALYYDVPTFLILSSRLREDYWVPPKFANFYKNSNIDCQGCNSETCKFNDTRCINNDEMLNNLNLHINNFFSE